MPLAGAQILFFLLTACSSVSQTKDKYDPTKVDLTPVNGGSYVEASISDASYLNPILAKDSASSEINNLVFNGLLKFDKSLQITGDLAESWDVSHQGKTITFHLRKNVQWHDGVPFTSADVLFTYHMLIATHTQTAFGEDYKLITKAETPDPFTFRVTYGEPFAPALESWGMGIIPKHIYEGHDINTFKANRQPIGTGPFVFKEWIPDEKIVLTANPHYFRGRPPLNRYIYRIVPDMSVQFLELRQGSLGGMSPTPDQFNGYPEFFDSYNKFHYPAFRYDYVAFNLTHSLFSDIRVRQAISESINRQEIIDGVYQGLAVPATGPFPPTSWAYNPNVKVPAYDLEAAKNKLAAAGWIDHDGDGLLDKNGKIFEFTLTTNQGNKVRESMSQIIQNSLRRIGIKMDIRIVEWSVFLKYMEEKQFEAVLLGWNLARDPDCHAIWHSSNIGKGQYNFVTYKNTEVDQLIEEGRHTFDREKRKNIYQKIHALIANDTPYAFLVVPESLPVVHKKYIGVEQAPAGIGWNFEEWFIPKAWQTKNELRS
ncbi:MAG: Oligopeptide-binding protein AppA [Elusimicrobia bacterium]|nr:Oligopeptide-binding protein AppA [Elusimicrobiota bacterium]